jgi:hypothetical protein
VVAGGSAGSGASVSVTGDDSAGTITITTGSGATAGVLANLTFANAYGATPHIVISPDNNATAAAEGFQSSPSTTGFSISAHQGISPSGTYIFDYVVEQ